MLQDGLLRLHCLTGRLGPGVERVKGKSRRKVEAGWTRINSEGAKEGRGAGLPIADFQLAIERPRAGGSEMIGHKLPRLNWLGFVTAGL
jgi:hypothetical protein